MFPVFAVDPDLPHFQEPLHCMLCPGISFTQPYDDLLGALINFAHERNLLVALLVRSLVDADAIDPELPRLLLVSELAKGKVAIGRDSKHAAAAID
jgi:hypothetical protein